MASLSEKLRSSGNSLIDRLRGIETPQMTQTSSRTENPQNEAIFEEVRGLKERGIGLSKIKKAIDVMGLPNAEEVKNFARNLFFNSELTPSDNKLIKPKINNKDEELQTEIQELLSQGKDKNIVERAIDLADEIKDKKKAKDILKSLVSVVGEKLRDVGEKVITTVNPQIRENKRIQEDIGERVKKKVFKEYPFTDEAKNIIERNVETIDVSPNQLSRPKSVSEENQMEFITNPKKAGRETEGERNIVEKVLSSILLSQSKNKKSHVALKDLSSLTTAHEFLHSLVRNEDNFNFNKFNSEWGTVKNSNSPHENIMSGIDKNLEEYENISESQRANERFAYFGSLVGRRGIEVFPSEFYPFYKNILSRRQKVFEIPLTTSKVQDEKGGYE